MKSFLSIIIKIIIGLLIITFLLGAGILGVRYYNTKKYEPSENAIESEFSDPTNLEMYETVIEGVEIKRIVGDYLNGFHLKPENKTHKGIIVTFGGSEGSPNYGVASRLAQSGYEVLSMFYFGMENQKAELLEVPLDFFDEVLDYIVRNVDDRGVLTLMGMSKGAELSLNLGARYPEINNLILIAPGEYSYPGLAYETEISNDMKSSWTWKGEPVPFIDFTKGDIKSGLKMIYSMITMNPVSFRDSYQTSTTRDPNSEAARIKVENTDANILLIAGTDDLVWQSEVAAKNIYDKRPEGTEVLIYDGAGHIFFQDRYFYTEDFIMAMGGTKEINEKAGIESNQIMMKRLEEWHR